METQTTVQTVTQTTGALTDELPVDQHSLGKSALLHLLPGVFILAAYLILHPVMAHFGLPALCALLLAVLVAAIPSQLGHLLYQGYRRNGRLSLTGIVVFRQRLPLWRYLLFVPLGIIWSFGWYGLLSPTSTWLMHHAFGWLPGWFLRTDLATTDHTVLVVTLAALLILNGIVAPVVEEMYFRGYLLPRLSRYGKAAPWINLALFTVYHLWQPWLYPTILVALTSLVFPVWWLRNIRLGIIIHCALNLIGGLGTAALLLGQHS
jgi:membrane protease YdiL (CAAX protease family)